MSELEFQKAYSSLNKVMPPMAVYAIITIIALFIHPEFLLMPIIKVLSFIYFFAALICLDIWLTMLPSVIHKYKMHRKFND